MVFKTAKQNGFTIVELMLVVAVGILLIASGIMLSKKSQDQRKRDETIELLRLIKDKAHALYLGHGTYGPYNTNLTTPIIAAGGIPERFINRTTNRFASPYNTPVHIHAGLRTDQLGVRFWSLNRKQCIAVSLALYESTEDDLRAMSINDVFPAPINQPTPGFASINCLNNNTNYVSWTFR